MTHSGFSSSAVDIEGAHLQVEALAFVRTRAPLDRRPLAKTYDVRLGGAKGSAREPCKTEEHERQKTIHVASLCIRQPTEQEQPTHQPQLCSQSGTGLREPHRPRKSFTISRVTSGRPMSL